MKGHPIRGFLAGLLLGIVLDADLFFGGVVESDSTTLVIVPIVCIIAAFLLGLWAPIGRSRKRKDVIRPNPQPLPAPVAWPDAAPVERSAPPPPAWKAPPPDGRPPDNPAWGRTPPSARPPDADPPAPPPTPPVQSI